MVNILRKLKPIEINCKIIFTGDGLNGRKNKVFYTPNEKLICINIKL